MNKQTSEQASKQTSKQERDVGPLVRLIYLLQLILQIDHRIISNKLEWEKMCSSFTPHNFSQTITLLALFAFCSVFRTVAIAVFNLCEWRRTRTPHNHIIKHVFFLFILFSFSFVLFLSKLNLMAFVGSKSYFCNFFSSVQFFPIGSMAIFRFGEYLSWTITTVPPLLPHPVLILQWQLISDVVYN